MILPTLRDRRTEELLGSAERSIWATTYAFFDGPKAFEVLARRMEATPALRVTLLLNIQRKRGDTTASEQLVRGFADHFWKADWPGSSRPSVFYDPRALDPEGPGGVLHAKAVVVDDEAVFITSANLTEAALDRNIELGVLIRDRAFALTVGGYFRSLIDRDLLKVYLSAYAQRLGATRLTFYDDDVVKFFSPHAERKSAIFLTAVGRSVRSRN